MKRSLQLLVAAVVAVSLFAAACGDDEEATDETSSTTAATVPDGPEIKVGAQDFAESKVLAEVYAQALRAKGYATSVENLGGFRDLVIGAFDSGDINFTPEYAASMLEFLNDKAGEASSDVGPTVSKLQTHLDEKELVAFEPAPGVDTNAFVMTSEKATELGVTKISDLAGKEADLKLGAAQDCETNPNCIPGLKQTYGVDLSGGFTPLETGAAIATALDEGAIDIAVLFSTDGLIADKGFTVLEDDKGLFLADNIVPVASKEVVDTYGSALETLVNSISAKLTTDELTQLNKRFTVDKEDASAIAKDWLTDNGFLS